MENIEILEGTQQYEIDDAPFDTHLSEDLNPCDENVNLPAPIEEFQIIKNGSKDSYVTFGIFTDGEFTDKLTIKSTDFRSRKAFINHYSLKRFACFSDKRWDEFFDVNESLLLKAPFRKIYEGVGWIEDNETFLHGNVIITRENIQYISSEGSSKTHIFSPEEKQEICSFAQEIMLTLGNNEFIIITIILYYILSLLKSRFYCDFKFCPSFALLINGITGSRKTSSTVPLANPTGEKQFECSFTDSEASISRTLKENSNGCTIIDDFKCNSTQNNRRFEKVIRLSGDNTTNAKTVDGGKINNTVTTGMAVFTGEEVPNLQDSSFPRMLILTFDNDTINNPVLSKLVDNIAMYNSFIHLFIQQVMGIQNFSSEFTNKVKEERMRYAEITRAHHLHDRYPEILSWMSVMWDYVKDFFSANDVPFDFLYQEELVTHIIKQSNMFDRDPVSLFTRAFFELQDSYDFKIADYQEMKNGKAFDICESDDHYFLRSKIVFKKIEDHLAKQNIKLTCSEGDLRKELYKKGLLVKKNPNLYTYEYKDRKNNSYTGMLIMKNIFKTLGGN